MRTTAWGHVLGGTAASVARTSGRFARFATALVVVGLSALLPEAAAACPVCFDPREENRLAFLGTTIFLSLLPLGMVFGAGMWLRKRSQGMEGTGQPTDFEGASGSAAAGAGAAGTDGSSAVDDSAPASDRKDTGR